MVIPTELIYDSAPLLNHPVLGIRTWRAIVAGTITEMHMEVDDSGTGTLRKGVFNIRKNGVPLFSTSQRFEFDAATQYIAKTGLSIPVSLNDKFSLDFERSGQTIRTPIFFLMRTEE